MTITLPSMKVLTPGVPFSAAAVNAAIRQQRVNLQNVVNGVTGFEKLTWVNSAATLATDTLDLTSTTRVVEVDTEGAGATDNLSTISNGTAYQQLWIKAANAGRVITVKHNVGNIKLWGAVDGTLSSTNWLQLFYDGTQWSDVVSPSAAPAQSLGIITARTVVGSSVATVTISSIPATYKHLIFIIEPRSATAATTDNVLVRFNADATAANYYTQYAVYNATSGSIGEQLGAQIGIYIPNMSGSLASAGNAHIVLFISNYASTTLRRNVTFQAVAHLANTIEQFAYGGGDWTNTSAAISSITFSVSSGANILANSAYTLYGLN